MWFWKKNKPVIRFVCTPAMASCHNVTMIKPARDIKPSWYQEQKIRPSDQKFANCPGMMDAMHAGYIIPAWTDIHIKANKAGTVVVYNKEGNNVPPAAEMSTYLTNNFLNVDNNVKFVVIKITLPWHCFADEGYSIWLTKPLFHAPYLQDLHVYPGIVDCDGLPTMNFIFSPLKECEIHIPFGAPLLQIIPFKREDILAEVGAATQRERDRIQHALPARVLGIYRKLFHRKKKYTVQEREYK